MAPQVLRKRPYTKSVDIWSSAIIMYMLFNNGKHPLASHKTKMSAEEYLHEVIKPWPKLQNELAQDFIQKISKIQPIERYTAAEALKHPFLTRNKNDPIPLTYNESFKSFQINQRYSQKIRLAVILSKYFEVNEKIVINKSYLQKVDNFNHQSQSYRNKINLDKKNLSKKNFSSQDIREIFSAFQSKNKHQSIDSDSPKKIDHCLKSTRATHMINFSFVSHFDECIKIRDLKQENEQNNIQKNIIKISEVTNHQNSQTRLQQFLANSSFSPKKLSQKKKYMLNFPKISKSKEKIHEFQNINSIIPQQHKSRILSPRKRIVSCRKYTRPVQQNNQSKMK